MPGNAVAISTRLACTNGSTLSPRSHTVVIRRSPSIPNVLGSIPSLVQMMSVIPLSRRNWLWAGATLVEVVLWSP